MIVVGLTGSIGMGKSVAVRLLRRQGVPVYDADAAVHEMYAAGGEAVAPLRALFPQAVKGGAVDRAALSRIIAADPAALKRIEAIVHPLARARQAKFLRQAALRRAPIAVLDIPLLYETGGDKRCDAVIVVSAPAFLQRQRVLGRPGMTAEKFALILSKQMPDAQKRRRADFVLPGHRGFHEAGVALARILQTLRRRKRRKRRA